MLLADIVGPAKVGDRQRVLRGQLPVARSAALVAPQRLDGIHATRLTHELATPSSRECARKQVPVTAFPTTRTLGT